ncbi:MAG: hypothetical protein HYY15_04480 [Candidatus Omnitrophica bacterium]|nr:hypothetical protein [Candidatus Omnitrophota bacterium]
MSRRAIRYEFDRANRLILRDPADALRPTRVLEGTLTTDRRNRLQYEISAPSVEDLPRTVTFEGRWTLTRQHDLGLVLSEQADASSRSTLRISGGLLRAEARALVFAWQRRERGIGQPDQQELVLHGAWEADARNRLTFLVERADGLPDRLTFQGGWDIGRSHELRYRYRRYDAVRRAWEERTLTFEGRWDLGEARRLIYRVEGSDTSAFSFTAKLQSPSLMARDGRIVYQIGLGLTRSTTEVRRVTLTGAWKIGRDSSVSFEIPYARGRAHGLRLEGTWRLGPRSQAVLTLHDARGEPWGATVVFTRTLAGKSGASLFVRLQKTAEERSVLAGMQVRF